MLLHSEIPPPHAPVLGVGGEREQVLPRVPAQPVDVPHDRHARDELPARHAEDHERGLVAARREELAVRAERRVPDRRGALVPRPCGEQRRRGQEGEARVVAADGVVAGVSGVEGANSPPARVDCQRQRQPHADDLARPALELDLADVGLALGAGRSLGRCVGGVLLLLGRLGGRGRA